MNEIASRYGLALFQIAKEDNSIVSLKDEVKVLQDILLDNKEYVDVISSMFLSRKEKMEYVDKALCDFNINILNLVKILIENNRIHHIFDVLECFISLCNEAIGILEGIVYSVIALDKETLLKLEKKISIKENTEVHLKNKIDSTLIGGIKIVIHDRVYDGSIKNKIEQMKLDLRKKED
jgi:F-type H+-transporting ATPase subunit delta